MYRVNWKVHSDDDGNSYWVAPGPIGDHQGVFYWRLRQKIVDNKICWYGDHDSDLYEKDELYESLESAMKLIEEYHEQIILDNPPEDSEEE